MASPPTSDVIAITHLCYQLLVKILQGLLKVILYYCNLDNKKQLFAMDKLFNTIMMQQWGVPKQQDSKKALIFTFTSTNCIKGVDLDVLSNYQRRRDHVFNDPCILYCMQLGMENLGIFQNNVVFFQFWLFLILVEPFVQFQEQMFNIIPNVPIMFS